VVTDTTNQVRSGGLRQLEIAAIAVSSGGHEGLEERRLLGPGGQAFRVPLDADHEFAIATLHALDRPVGRVRGLH